MRDALIRHRKLLLVTVAVLVAVPLAGCVATGAVTNATPQKTQTREFNVFNGGLDFNQSMVGMPHDMFVPDHLVVNKGDTVLIHFHNVEDTDEHHTFTIGAPYDVNVDVAPGDVGNVTFVASQAGVFDYVCNFHLPTMTGQLLVVG